MERGDIYKLMIIEEKTGRWIEADYNKLCTRSELGYILS